MESKLPEEFHLGQELSWFLHNTLVNIIKTGEPQGVFNSRFDLTEEEAREFEQLSSEEVYDWMIANGNFDFVHKQLCLALLADLCQYVYTGLECSELGKQAVAFTLFRKPFKENLLYLEWLLTEPAEMLDVFHWGDTDERDAPRHSVSKRKEIIGAAVAKTSQPSAFNADFIYDLRYDKKVGYGLERSWNPAIHLVTGNKNYATAAGDLNFVFLDDTAMTERWRILDATVPYLLFYTVEVVEALVDRFSAFAEGYSINVLRRQLGFILWGRRHEEADASSREADALFDSFKEIIPKVCPNCSSRIDITDKNLRTFLWRMEIECQTCEAAIRMRPDESDSEDSA